MNGTIYTRSGQHWSAAGWVFRSILDRTAEVLVEQGQDALARLLTDEDQALRDIEEMRLSDLSNDDRRSFLLALHIAYDRFVSEGPTDWNLPEFYPGFLARFEELLERVSSD